MIVYVCICGPLDGVTAPIPPQGYEVMKLHVGPKFVTIFAHKEASTDAVVQSLVANYRPVSSDWR